MNTTKALGWFIVGLINQHFPHPDEPWDDDGPEVNPLGDACDNRVCGPCSALVWFSDPARRDVLEGYIRATGYVSDYVQVTDVVNALTDSESEPLRTWAYWDDETDSLRWEWFTEYWARHRACWVSNGVTGCFGDDEESGESEK